MEQEVYQARKNLKDFAFRRGRRAVVTVSTWGLVKRLEDVWMDQVKLKEKGYFVISEGIVEATAALRGKRRGLEATSATPGKRQRLEMASTGNESNRGHIRGRGGVPRASAQTRRGQPHTTHGGNRGGGWTPAGRGWQRGQPYRGRATHQYFY
jgi:hypothetical protein